MTVGTGIAVAGVALAVAWLIIALLILRSMRGMSKDLAEAGEQDEVRRT